MTGPFETLTRVLESDWGFVLLVAGAAALLILLIVL
jgi:hypothetical protein